MAVRTRLSRPRHRVGLVLGAGGILGASWMTGALSALQERLPDPVGEADVIVGTSAGSVLAAALRCGACVDDLVAYQRGSPPESLGVLCTPDLGCGATPPWPRWGIGSPRLLAAALRAPRRVHPWAAAAACLPPGRAEHVALRTLVAGLLTDCTWPPDRQTWITAVDYDSGKLVVFGRAGAPPAELADAVTASCSVPGWFQPTVIAGRRYIDGGVRSGTNADVLTGALPEQVYVLAPAASLDTGRPHSFGERAERWLRRCMTRAMQREVAALRAAGCRVRVLTPGPDDLRAMGGNLMDAARRSEVFETSLRTAAEALGPVRPGSYPRPAVRRTRSRPAARQRPATVLQPEPGVAAG